MIPHRLFTQLICFILVVCFANVANGDYPNYTDAERIAIDKLRPLIAEYLVPDYMKTDVYHLRLLKATKLDVNSAVEMVKQNSKWRKQNNVDEILNEDLSEYFPDFPFKLEGVDKEGRPIYQCYFGKWKLRKYALSGDPKLRNVPGMVLIYTVEAAEQRLYEVQKSRGENISSIYVLNDVDGFSFHEHVCTQCLAMTVDSIRTGLHYPSFLKKHVSINAPRIFSRVNQLINVILPAEIAQTFSIYAPDDNKWRTDILKDISPDQLPKDFGGTQK